MDEGRARLMLQVQEARNAEAMVQTELINVARENAELQTELIHLAREKAELLVQLQA